MEILENRVTWEAAFTAGWLRHYQTTGQINWDLYNRPNNRIAPAGKGIDLRLRRLLLISSAGSYLRTAQTPFDADNDLGDYSIRRFPITTPSGAIAFAHTHYDHTAVNADQQVLLPLGHLQDLVATGVIGELAPDVINFMGYQPDIGQVLDVTIPAILGAAKEMHATAALLVPS